LDTLAGSFLTELAGEKLNKGLPF